MKIGVDNEKRFRFTDLRVVLHYMLVYEIYFLLMHRLQSSGGLGYTWSKNFCMYTKENKIFTMVPYVQTQARLVSIFVMIIHLHVIPEKITDVFY